MITSYFIILVLSFAISLFTVPIFGKLAYRYGIVDNPNREGSEKRIPYLGGCAIYVGFLLPTTFDFLTKLFLTILFLLGLLNDVKSIKKTYIIVTEITVAFFLVLKYQGFDFYTPIFLLIVFGLINAVKKIDKIDGVCGSISLLSLIFLTFTVTASFERQLLLAGAGSTIGFLIYNYPPSRILMGKAGNYLLSGLLSIGLLSSFRADFHTSTSSFISVFIFFLVLVPDILTKYFNSYFKREIKLEDILNRIYKLSNENKKRALYRIIIIHIVYLLISIVIFLNRHTTLAPLFGFTLAVVFSIFLLFALSKEQ